LCSFLHSPVTSFLLGPNILLNTLFYNTLSLRSSLTVSDQFGHSNKTTSKIIILCILIFIFLVNKLGRKSKRIPSIFKDESIGSCICLWKLAVAVATYV
jgi:hypothetical protein